MLFTCISYHGRQINRFIQLNTQKEDLFKTYTQWVNSIQKTVEYLRTSGNNINSDSCQIISQLLPELSLKLDLMIFTRGGKKSN